MGKIDEINNYLTNNSSRTRDNLISNLVKKFEISKKSAETYYYSWKKEFMKTSNMGAKKVSEEVSRQVEKEIKKDHIAEVGKKVDDLEVLEEEVIKHIKVKGRNGIYEAKTGLGVALENGEYKLAFCNVEEVEEFCNEFKKVFERI